MKLFQKYWRIGCVLVSLVISIAFLNGAHIAYGHGGGHGGACVMELTMSDNPDPVIPGSNVTYHLTLRNTGTRDCTGGGVLLKNTFDPRISYVSHSVVPADYLSYADPVINSSNHYVQLNFAVMHPGEVRDVDVVFNVLTSFVCGDPLANSAKFFSDQTGWGDPVTESTQVTCPIIENSIPVITLIGSSTIQIDRGQVYTDPGATAQDDEDGNITANIVVTGLPVNTSSTGTSTIRYNVVDSDGAPALEVTRTVIVVATSTGGGDTGGGTPTSTPPTGGGGSPAPENHPIVTVGGGSGTFPSATPSIVITGGSAQISGSVLGVATSTVQECNYLLEYIRFGAQNNPFEVRKLQTFLRNFEGFQNLQVTGFYDVTTFEAAKVFQTRYGKDVLDPWALNGPTGYVYITTKKKVNEIYCNRQFPLTDAQVSEIGYTRELVERLRSQGASPEEIRQIEGGLGGVPSTANEGIANLSSSTNASGTRIVSGSFPIAATAASGPITERLMTLAGFFTAISWQWVLAILIIILFLWLNFSGWDKQKKMDESSISEMEYDKHSDSGSIVGSV